MFRTSNAAFIPREEQPYYKINDLQGLERVIGVFSPFRTYI